MHSVLVVDDEELVRADLRHIIEGYKDYNIIGEAGNGREAINLAEKYLPDIILMDIKMPGVDGLKATQKIKEISHNISIIIFTAYDDFDYARQAIHSGANEYLLKPAEPNEIFSVLELMAYQQIQREDLDENLISISDTIDETLMDANYPWEEEKILLHGLKTYDLDHVNQGFSDFFQRIETNGSSLNMIIIYILKLNAVVFRTINDYGFSKNDLKLETKNVNKIMKIKKMDDIKDTLEQINKQIINFIELSTLNDNKELKKGIICYIQSHYKRDISLEKVAQYFHFSPSYLTRILKKETGLCYSEYVNKLRLDEAKVLLRDSSLDINKISDLVGYNKVSHFNRVFKKEIGTNPSKYRKLFAGENFY